LFKFESKVTKLSIYISLIWLSFQTYIIFFPSQPLLERPLHLIFALLLIFFFNLNLKKIKITDSIIFILLLSFLIYFFFSFERLVSRMETVDEIFKIDVIF